MTDVDESHEPSAADQFQAELNDWTPPALDPMIDFFVYGQTGTGKTTLTKTLKGDCIEHGKRALLLTCDKGNDSILSAIHDPDQWLIPREIDSMNDLRAAISYLLAKDHPFRWIVLDDCTRMASIMNEELKGEFGDDTWGRYGALNDRFRKMLRRVRGMEINSLFLAREGKKEESQKRTAAFPGKALGEGNDKSSVLHEFTFAARMVCEPVDNPSEFEHIDQEGNRYYLDFHGGDEAEAKKRDEFHVLDPREVPDISSIRERWVGAQREEIEQ